MSKARNIGVVVLAAGASKRLGQPKQLVNYKGKPLLQQVMDCTAGIQFQSKVIVLGAYHEELSQAIEHSGFRTAINHNWVEGMGSSLKTGIQKSLEQYPDLEAILILVSDQPFISGELLKKMIELYGKTQDIIACEYDGIVGVPTLFGKAYFDELMNQSGDRGAKQILKNHKDNIKVVPFEQGIFDIDTQEDLEKLKEDHGSHN